MITIIDYGIGNLGSISNMLKKLNVASKISSDNQDIMAAEKLILPGVGAFEEGVKNLGKSGLIGAIKESVIEKKTPILGICLGMQLLGEHSEEGEGEGLGFLPFYTQKFSFPSDITLNIPHMGWNTVEPVSEHPLFSDLAPNRFYFVHSFHAVAKDPRCVLATSEYGYPFACSVGQQNVMGVQFHPEKSHRFGMTLLKNFAERC
jgi:glutamine amidotransferase